MLRQQLYQQRGNHKTHTLVFDGDITARKLEFGVKADKEVEGTRLISKSFTPGGSSNGISVDYDNAADQTTVTITVNRADTYRLDETLYYYDLNSIDPDDTEDLETIAIGKFNIELSVQSPFDDVVDDEAAEYADSFIDKKLIAKINSDGTGTKERDSGFNTTLTFERVSLGNYKITSSAAMFDENIMIDFRVVAQSSEEKRYFFGWHYTTNKILFIQVTDFASGLADLQFRAIIERVRQA